MTNALALFEYVLSTKQTQPSLLVTGQVDHWNLQQDANDMLSNACGRCQWLLNIIDPMPRVMAMDIEHCYYLMTAVLQRICVVITEFASLMSDCPFNIITSYKEDMLLSWLMNLDISLITVLLISLIVPKRIIIMCLSEVSTLLVLSSLLVYLFTERCWSFVSNIS